VNRALTPQDSATDVVATRAEVCACAEVGLALMLLLASVACLSRIETYRVRK
jgi:hypothetical protein